MKENELLVPILYVLASSLNIFSFIPTNDGLFDTFDVELDGSILLAGRIRSAEIATTNILTVMFQATAGQQITVRNTSGHIVTIGVNVPYVPGAYISIHQIN